MLLRLCVLLVGSADEDDDDEAVEVGSCELLLLLRVLLRVLEGSVVDDESSLLLLRVAFLTAAAELAEALEVGDDVCVRVRLRQRRADEEALPVLLAGDDDDDEEALPVLVADDDDGDDDEEEALPVLLADDDDGDDDDSVVTELSDSVVLGELSSLPSDWTATNALEVGCEISLRLATGAALDGAIGSAAGLATAIAFDAGAGALEADIADEVVGAEPSLDQEMDEVETLDDDDDDGEADDDEALEGTLVPEDECLPDDEWWCCLRELVEEAESELE